MSAAKGLDPRTPLNWQKKYVEASREREALRRIVTWACDTEDVDFFTRDNPNDIEAISLIYGIVISPGGRDGHRPMERA